MKILLKNCTVLPMTASGSDTVKYFKADIGISQGRIDFVSDDRDQSERFAESADCIVIDADGKIAMPGLINLHNHAAMTLMRSYADDMALMPWLQEKIWPFEAKLTREDIFLGTSLGVAEMLLGGTTTFVDMYWETDMVARAALEGGIRSVVSASFIDGRLEKSINDVRRVMEQYGGRNDRMVQVRIAPHAPYTNCPETIAAALGLAREYELSLQVHLSETAAETEIVRKRYGKSPAEYLRDLGMFDLPTLAAHCVHLSDSDMEILSEYKVSVSHNPQSNMKLASGIAPVVRMIEAGINVGIGTDGPSSNNDLDMWEEMRTASLLQKVSSSDPCALPAYQTLQMATVNGAKAIGMEGELGIIAPGALADIILVDTNSPHMQPSNDLIADLVYCAKASDVDTVIVNGRLVVSEGKLLGKDLDSLYATIRGRIEELKKQ